MKENKTVSIILPAHNGAKFIKDAISSVLTQTFTDWELLVVDDGSKDETPNIVKKFADRDNRVRYIKNKSNLGVQKSLNVGLRSAKGKYIARIDDDDHWSNPDKLKLQVEFLDSNPRYVIVGTGIITVDENGKELFRYFNPETNEDIRRSMLTRNCFIHSSVMFRKEAAMQFGGYSEKEEARHIEDYDLWLKFGGIGKMANLPVYATGFMMRPRNIASKHKVEQFRKGAVLAKRFKKNYPRQYQSLARNKIRVVLYWFFGLMPRFLQNWIFKIYKERY